jgi:NADH dehydrogenase/NADH:ubiquinone oxidoreductase subunit G
MIQAQINGRSFFTVKEISILEACKFIGIKIPRFCYHENLSIAGNCRMCLVEVVKVPKPIASCAVLLEDNMIVNTEGPFVLKARANVLEALLLNHPLDCPICDQGGECDLQDQSKMYGNSLGRNYSNKRGVEDKYSGPLIKTIMTRCIHCTRCVRFTNEICGVKLLGTLNRGNNVEISNYIKKVSFSGMLSNVVDLCPVGALTFKPSSFQIRSWEVKSLESIDLTDGLGGNLYINYKELDIIRILPKKNSKINESWVSDKARFSINNNFTKTNLSKILPYISKLKATNRIVFLINNETNLETLNLLQQLSFLSKGNIKIKNFLQTPLCSNVYFWSNHKKVQNISISKVKNQLTLFLSSNLNVESCLLNVRIRTKFFSVKKNIFSFGNYFSSNFPVSFLKLNSSSLLNIFSAKNYFLTKYFLTNSIFLFYGKSFINRIDKNIIAFFKKKIPTLVDYKINTYSNLEGLKYFNLNSCGANNFKTANIIFNFFLDDNLYLRKKSLIFSDKMVWLSSYNSKLALNTNMSFLANDLDKTGAYLNLEQRPQKATRLVNFFLYSESLKYFLDILKEHYLVNSFKHRFNKNPNSLKRDSILKVFSEILQLPELFDKTQSALLNQSSMFRQHYYSYSNYPLKLIINDFFRTSSLSKHSITLTNCSHQMRKEEQLFR